MVVTRAAGHTPQVVGARMLVRADGAIEGTVGGGRFEHEVTARARHAAGGGDSELLTLELGAELGMCCGGIMEVLITPLSTDAQWLFDVVRRLEGGRQTWLHTSLDEATLGQRTLGGPVEALPGKRRFKHAGVIETPDSRTLVEQLAPAARMVLFGAGHVAGPTARIAGMLGWRVVVVDDRADWNNADRFPDVAERVLDPYEDYLAGFDARATDALLIVTRGHDFDQQILEAVIGADVAYLGMIGSKSKVHKSLQKLRAKDVPQARIDRLHAPIGLDIGSLTPEEIAVAIVAEIVQVSRQ